MKLKFQELQLECKEVLLGQFGVCEVLFLDPDYMGIHFIFNFMYMCILYILLYVSQFIRKNLIQKEKGI